MSRFDTHTGQVRRTYQQRPATGDDTRGETCERLGLNAIETWEIAQRTFKANVEEHIARGRPEAQAFRLAIADTYLAGVMQGASGELRNDRSPPGPVRRPTPGG